MASFSTLTSRSTASINDQKNLLKIQQLRSHLEHEVIHEDDRSLLKWLEARNYNVEDAKKMYLRSERMKKKFGTSRILAEYTPPEVFLRYFPWGVCGFDKEGSPISVERLGKMDLKGLMRSMRKSDLEKTRFWQSEKYIQLLKEQTIKLEKPVDSITVILDAQGMGRSFLWRPGMKMHGHLVNVMDDNYPGLFKRLFVINAPKILPLLWMMAKPLYNVSIGTKISVLTDNYEDDLLNAIDPDQLPACYGGTLTDPDGDPWCKTIIPLGGHVPQEYYIKHTVNLQGLDEIFIKPSRYFYVECDVKFEGSVIKWEFFTQLHDIGFGVLFKSTEGATHDKEVIPFKKYNCGGNIEDGFYVCEEEGKYVVVFDNSHSWARWKQVFYSVELLLCDQENEDEVNTWKMTLQPKMSDARNTSPVHLKVKSITRLDCGTHSSQVNICRYNAPVNQ